MTKIVSILLVVLALNAGFAFPPVTRSKWIVERNSSLSIQGETNVNNFRCDVTEYLYTDTLFFEKNDPSGKLLFADSRLRIDIRRFDCHSKFITNDFRNALNADDYPVLVISFLSLDQFTNPCDKQSVKGMVDVGLANVTRRAEICYTVKAHSSGRIELNGTHVFTFSDFKLKAPKKMAGLIRTKDQIKVNFRLFFRAV